MSPSSRVARVWTPAKLNLTLEVLNKRPDGYHNLRTIFQTISLHDTLNVEYTPGRRTLIELDSNVEIANNLVVRAAEAVVEWSNARGRLRFRLRKRIPMGGGLGGGSTNAAAVLLTVPVLTGRPLSLEKLLEIASSLGSDIPFFLTGGTALGLSRGTEIYPLPNATAKQVLVVAPGVHVSTAEAYSSLGRTLTSPDLSHKINVSQSLALRIGGDVSAGGQPGVYSNDFESVVFRQHPLLGEIKDKLKKAGASPALMTGSGAAVFGVFESTDAVRRAKRSLRHQAIIDVSFVTRPQYRSLWWRALAEHSEGKKWPPRSRYSR
jgi:4-diphosphocytidyl-2-C-methyl-D-erythritol kinase